MNIIRVNGWYGRLNNNIIQLLNCIRIAEEEGYNVIYFPNHQYLRGNSIKISDEKYEKKTDLNDDFYEYYMKRKLMNDFKKWKIDFDRYIKPIMKLNFEKHIEKFDNVIYIRSTDMVYHNGLPQPPLSFYMKFISKYSNENIKLICEDLTNPCAKWLVDNTHVKWKKQSLEDDILYIVNAKNLTISYGTFCFLPLIVNTNLENLWIPDYLTNEIPRHWRIYIQDFTNKNIEIILLHKNFLIETNKSNYFKNLLKY
jgi:hypothetical protein